MAAKDESEQRYRDKCTELGIDPLPDVVKALRAPQIHKLALGAGVTSRDVRAFAYALPHSSTLTLLKLADCIIGDEGCIALADALQTATCPVQRIYFKSNGFGLPGATALARALRTNGVLVEVSVIDNALTSEGCVRIADAMSTNGVLQRLVLSECGIDNIGAEALARMLQSNRSLRRIDLEKNNISAPGAHALAAGLSSNRGLETVQLFDNPIGNEGAAALAPVLCTRFTAVNLSYCNLGPHAADSLARALQSSSQRGRITSINLDGNRIASAGASALARVLLDLAALEELSLNENKIGDTGAVLVARAIGSCRAMRRVLLGDNIVRDAGALALAEAFRANPELSMISIERNFVTEEGEQRLAAVMESNDSAGQMDISRQQEREPYVLTLEQEEEYFNNRDDQSILLAEASDAYQLDCRAQGAVPSGRLLETLGDLRGDQADSGEVQVPTEIVLSNEDVGDAEVKCLVAIVGIVRTVSTLLLDFNRIGAAGAEALSRGLLSPTCSIATLVLTSNRLGADGATHLGKALQGNQSLRHLYLDDNQIGDDGVEAIAFGLLENRTLQYLSVLHNNITAYGMSHMANALRTNATLMELDVSTNNIGDEGVRALCLAAATHRALVTLVMTGVGATPSSADAVAQLIAGSLTLQTLVLDQNRIADGANVIAQSLSKTRTLSKLSMLANGIPDSVAASVMAATRVHPSLMHVLLDNRLVGSLAQQGPAQSSLSAAASGSVSRARTRDAPAAVGVGVSAGAAASSSLADLLISQGSVAQQRQQASQQQQQQQQQQPWASAGSDVAASMGGARPSAQAQAMPPYGSADSSAATVGPRVTGGGADFAPASAASKEIAEELAAVNRELGALEKRREQLLASYRASQERDWLQEFSTSKQRAVAGLRSNPANMQALPPIKPISNEERMYEANLERGFRQRASQHEREMDSIVAALEQLQRQRATLDNQVSTAMFELDDADNNMKKLMASGDPDRLAKAEALAQRKLALEEAIAKASDQKNAVMSQQIEEVNVMMMKLRELVELKVARQQHLRDCLAASGSAVDMKPAAFQQAIVNLGRLLELREQVGEAEKEESRAVDRWGESLRRLQRAREELRELERQEEKLYLEAQYYKQTTRETMKMEELFRAKINLADLPADEIRALIPKAQESFEFFAPMVGEERTMSESVQAAQEMAEKYDVEMQRLQSAVERRRDCVARLQDYMQLKAELDKKREFFRQWNAKISSLEESQRSLTEDVQEALQEGDFEEYRRTEQQLAKVTQTLESLESNRGKLSQEIERLSGQCEDMLSSLRAENKDDFVEMLLAAQVPHQARSPTKFRTIAAVANRIATAGARSRGLGGGGGGGALGVNVSISS